jgi:purine-binding chemotaxis protein CheW
MPESISLNTDAVSGAANLTQYLTCLLAGEQYGIGILQVQEIRGWEQVTRIPNTPSFVKGVINLRGAIIPVLDLRLRFGLPVESYGKETVVIVVRSKSRRGDDRSMGLIVDAVSDVVVADDDQVIATPEFGASVRTENIFGLVKQDGGMVRLLDVQSLLTVADGDEAE